MTNGMSRTTRHVSQLPLPYRPNSLHAASEHSISITFQKRCKINNVNATTKSCKCRIINRWW